MNRAELESFETAAGQAGDLMMAAICQIALNGEVREGTYGVLSEAERARAATFTRESALAECERCAS